MYKITENRFGSLVSTDAKMCSILVEGESDLAQIPADVAVGSVAYTASFSGLWMKGVDREWHKI